jgi:hypothetical protein
LKRREQKRVTFIKSLKHSRSALLLFAFILSTVIPLRAFAESFLVCAPQTDLSSDLVSARSKVPAWEYLLVTLLLQVSPSELRATPTIHVVHDPELNAYMGKNGRLTLTTGLLGAVTEKSEMVYVLGHELGHLARSPLQSPKNRSYQALFAHGAAHLDTHAEIEADQFAIELLQKSELDLKAPHRVLNRLTQASQGPKGLGESVDRHLLKSVALAARISALSELN